MSSAIKHVILNHIDIRVVLPRHESPYMIYTPPTARYAINPHHAPRELLNMVGPMGSNSRQIASHWLFIVCLFDT